MVVFAHSQPLADSDIGILGCGCPLLTKSRYRSRLQEAVCLVLGAEYII